MADKKQGKKRLIIGISGASGAIYGVRLLQVLSELRDVETHLIMSKAGMITTQHETDWELEDVKALADSYYDIRDIAASVGSGSFKREGMVVIPCSMKTLSALAHSYDENLLVRTGDVTLKERKKLILVVRETPLHLGHLRNMAKITEIGGIILPPSPAFYHRPKTIEEIIDHVIARILDFFDIENDLFPRWQGI